MASIAGLGSMSLWKFRLWLFRQYLGWLTATTENRSEADAAKVKISGPINVILTVFSSALVVVAPHNPHDLAGSSCKLGHAEKHHI